MLGQIAELMKPFMGIEAEEVPPDEKDAQLEALHQEKAQLEEEKAALEVKIAEKEEAEAAAQRRLAVKNRIDEALKGNADAEKIRPILEKCQTVEDVDAELPKVTALVEALKRKVPPKDGERKGTPPPTEAELLSKWLPLTRAVPRLSSPPPTSTLHQARPPFTRCAARAAMLRSR